MQCHGSAHLELAIPGYVEPKRDDAAGAKGVGTRMHDSFAKIARWSPLDLAELAKLVYEYSILPWRIRRRWVSNYPATPGQPTDVPPEVRLLVLQFPSAMLDWLSDLDKGEWLPPRTLKYVSEALAYYSELRSRVATASIYLEVRAEESLDCSWLPSRPKTTPDIVIAGDARLDVLDWKTGTVPVELEDNDQLYFYLVSALHAYYPGGDLSRRLQLFIHVVQPGNMVYYEVDYRRLMDWASRAVEADRAILSKDLTLQPGDHCTFCPANPHSRADKAAPWCPPMYQMLYPDKTNDDEILDL